MTGSSPRVRGKLLGIVIDGHELGLIPACAGKTVRFWGVGLEVWAHPRACGENRVTFTLRKVIVGSSPRVRGKPEFKRHQLAGVRLIPARAGKTASTWGSKPCSTAHPRACGENDDSLEPHAQRRGSSPRVRGKPARSAVDRSAAGLIPAYAGKTYEQPGIYAQIRAHPRVCGENSDVDS